MDLMRIASQAEIVLDSQSDKRERRLTKAVEYVQKYGFITNGIYRQLTGVSDRTVHRDIETLVERERLRAIAQEQRGLCVSVGEPFRLCLKMSMSSKCGKMVAAIRKR